MRKAFAKMSAKLVVHKFEEGFDYKYRYITIGNTLSETTFSDWKDGKQEQKKKKSESSRLVVKSVSGSDLGCIDLDSCSKEISNLNVYSNYISSWKRYDKNKLSYSHEMNDDQKNPSENKSDNTTENTYCFDYYGFRGIDNDCASHNTSFSKEKSNNEQEVMFNATSPLEHSLEKVKENNARIMENIHLLNRTLNYTKKKEILDVIWPGPSTMKTYPCNICGKHFVYVTGLKRHLAIRHVSPESQQWQIVWTCTECFQVWPSQDLARNHSGHCCKGNSTDNVHEIKTSSLLQCEFCEKVFTSIPRLLSHTKIHTVASNYECNPCAMSFQSYKNADQHWLFCPWLHMCYKFSLPKLLLCNACDRKFRNYEQLYNHRYKIGHFMTKVLTDDNNPKTSILVYQCEICGEWFCAIAGLLAHRNYYHPHNDSRVMSNTGP